MNTFRLPNGNTTKSEKVFVREWRKKAEVIEFITGLQAYGFDPGISFTSSDGRLSVHLPMWFIDKVEEGLKK